MTGARHSVELIPAARTALVEKVRTPSLLTAVGVAREMSRVYREVRSGRLDSQEGARRVYILDRLNRVIESALLEERLARLESRYGK